MIKNEYILKVDLKKKHTAVTPTFVQYDEAVLRFLISDNGKPFFFSGQTSIKTYHRRKDGVVVEGEARVEVVKGIQQIVYEYSGNEMYQLGFVETSLVIYSGNKKVSIQPFKVLIVDNIHDDVATPANPEYGALQNLIIRVEDLIDRAVEATDNANQAAENALKVAESWKYADNHDMATQYKKNNIVSHNGSSFIAIRDNIGSVPVGNAFDLYWRLVARKGTDGDGAIVLYREKLDGKAGQSVFNLANSYDRLQNRIHLDIGGVLQYSPEHFMETSSTSITLNYPLEIDMSVTAIYFGNAPALVNDLQLQIDEMNNIVQLFNLVETINAGNEAKVAAEKANSIAESWKYENAYNMATSYKKNNVVTYNGSSFIAIKDNKGIPPIGDTSDLNWRIMARKGADGVGLVVLHKDTFRSTLNQTDFILAHGYDQHQGRVRVIVDGVEQFTPENFIEQTSTKIKMNSTLRENAEVKIIYFGNAPAIVNNVQLQIDNINNIIGYLNLAEISNAISHATTQGDYAKVQGDSAKTAIADVNAIKDSANATVALANTTIQNTNTAKDATISATNRANTATALAESATSNANTATTNAITAANDANTAKNNANQAAVNANDAVANMSPKGAYSSTTNYLPRNIVSYLGSSYMNIVASKGVLPTVTANWQPVGSKGETGSGFIWKKEYVANTSYNKDDVVYYNGSSYIALKQVVGINPTNDNVNWNIITQRGIDGTGSVSSVNGTSPDLNGNVIVPTVTSVNNQTGVITGLETVQNSDSKLANKVDKVTGKQLSTEDFTTNEKTKLSDIQAGAQVNAITSVNGQTGAITGLATSISVDGKIGSLPTLTTTNKTDLVKAINEVNAKQSSGNVQDASTTQKGIVQLIDSHESASRLLVPTANALKTVSDATALHIQDDKEHMLKNGGFLNGASINYDTIGWNKVFQVADTTGATNPPPESYGVLLTHAPLNTSYGIQEFTSVLSGNKYIRTMTEGGFKPWAQLLKVTRDPWKQIPLQNGWTGYLHYRSSYPGYVDVLVNVTAGTVTPGIIIAQLPDGYRLTPGYFARIEVVFGNNGGIPTPGSLVASPDGTIKVAPNSAFAIGNNLVGSVVIPVGS